MTDEIRDILKKPLQYIKGVGEARAKLFHRLNLFTVEDVLTHFPREYEDRSSFKKIIMLEDGESCAFEGMIVSKVAESRPRRGLSIYKVIIRDETGSITGTWFNQSFIKKVFQVGERYVFYGKVSKKYRNFEIQNPVYEKVDEKELKNTGRIMPVYASTANLTQNILRSVTGGALKLVENRMEEVLPPAVCSTHHLCGINEALQNIHFPKSEEECSRARTRLVFEELLLLQLGLLNIKNSLGEEKQGISLKKTLRVEEFIRQLPFQLTCAQLKVFQEVERDMETSRVMNRLVQGDVGSGKTMIAVLALIKAVDSGYQGALMVPTEILAEQHFQTVSGLFEPLGIHTALLIGSQGKKEKTAVLEGLQTGAIDVVIGTHALIEDQVQFERLGLVITDEQHRFGVRQRAVLSRKGCHPNVLVMTATPIPRTLALILYGDLDISIIDELPPGRKPIETYAVDEGMRARINQMIRKKVAEGRQAYIVCPLVEDSEEVEAQSATEMADRIAKKDFQDLRVGLIHGKMKAREKEAVMRAFVAGNVDILVSTTVIEVGVNVPNATVMAVENAERFGLAQLHQLRGRVGRGEHQSYCILYNNSKSNVSRERMKVMQKTNDGFVISERDLELRGPGEFFGTRQHGIPELKIANLYRDMEILKLAQSAALEILREDRHLGKPEYAKLKETIQEKFRNRAVDL